MTTIAELDDIINRTGLHSNATSYYPAALQILAMELRELRLKEEALRDICGLCGNQRADKTPQMTYWPGERVPDKGRLVHKKCEDEERNRAFDALTPDEIADSFPS